MKYEPKLKAKFQPVDFLRLKKDRNRFKEKVFEKEGVYGFVYHEVFRGKETGRLRPLTHEEFKALP